MPARAILSLTFTLLFTATASAQLRPATRWALGLGYHHLTATGSLSSSGSGFGIMGLYAPMLSSTVGLEIEGKALLSSGSEAQPGCVPIPGAVCEGRTLVPSEVVGLDARLAYAPSPRIRLSGGPAVAWAPNVNGPNDAPAFGVSGGLGLSPLDRNGRGLGLELRGTRFFSRLGEVDWVFGTALTYRF